jgi:ABC-type sugar transport system substrate-binding protein
VGEFTLEALRLKQEEQALPSLSGRVVVIRGDESGDTCRLRQAGFTGVLLAQPDVILVHDGPGFWDRDQTAERFREAVRLQQDFDVIFAHSDEMARAARATAQEFEMQQRLLFIGIGGARGSEGGLAAVQRGVLGATVQLPDLTEDILEITVKLARDPSWRPTPAVRELPWTLITASNLPTDIGIGPLMPAPALIAPTPTPDPEDES